MAPSRASAESRGVSGPRWRGANPTTIIASTGFKFSSLFLPVFRAGLELSQHDPCRFYRPRKPACQTLESDGTLSIEMAAAREISFCIKELAG
jgi:hypothetical protein